MRRRDSVVPGCGSRSVEDRRLRVHAGRCGRSRRPGSRRRRGGSCRRRAGSCRRRAGSCRWRGSVRASGCSNRRHGRCAGSCRCPSARWCADSGRVRRFRPVLRFLRARVLHCPRRFRPARRSLPSAQPLLRCPVLCSPTWPVPPAVRVRRRVRRPPAVRCPVSRYCPVLPSDQSSVVKTAPPSSARGRDLLSD